MQEQNFNNHSRYVPLYHFVAFGLILAVLIGSVINLNTALSTGEAVYSALLILILAVIAVLVCWYARSFALKAQDRAIRAEENFRHFIAAGKPLDSRLRMGQIVALRFAGDDEFVALAKKAADENMPAKEIKMAIKNWKADNNRV